MGGNEEQSSSTWFGTTGLPKSANADSLATIKEYTAILSLITFTICRDIWHQDYNETEMIGGENFEGKGMFHTANQFEPQQIESS